MTGIVLFKSYIDLVSWGCPIRISCYQRSNSCSNRYIVI